MAFGAVLFDLFLSRLAWIRYTFELLHVSIACWLCLNVYFFGTSLILITQKRFNRHRSLRAHLPSMITGALSTISVISWWSYGCGLPIGYR